MLPPGLQVLRITEGLITTKGASKLPKSLTSLRAYLNAFDNNESLSYLRHISKIELSIREDIPVGDLNPNWLSSLLPPSSSFPTPNGDCVSGGCTDIYENNNYHLSSCKIVGPSSTDPLIQKPFFDSLQKFKNLKKLSISSCGGISSDWLCLIPQNVTVLKLSLSTFPTATQLSMLPTCLKYLRLRVGDNTNFECDWTDEALQSLPQSLHEFWITASDFPNLTHRMYEYLPPNLQDSTLKYKTDGSYVDFEGPLQRNGCHSP